MFRPRTSFLILLLVGLAMLTGCKKVDEKRQANNLEATLSAYEASLRWGSVADAHGYRPPEQVAETGLPADLDQIRVVSYQAKGGPLMLDDQTASQTVEIGYYRLDDQRLRTLTDRQTWVYDWDLRLWRLETPVPAFP